MTPLRPWWSLIIFTLIPQEHVVGAVSICLRQVRAMSTNHSFLLAHSMHIHARSCLALCSRPLRVVWSSPGNAYPGNASELLTQVVLTRIRHM